MAFNYTLEGNKLTTTIDTGGPSVYRKLTLIGGQFTEKLAFTTFTGW
jgi:hypothetical protein